MMYRSVWTIACSKSKPLSSSLGSNLGQILKRLLASLKGDILHPDINPGLTYFSLFYGTIRQRVTVPPLESTSAGKAAVNEKDDLFSHLPVNVSDEGYDLYDGLSGYFQDNVEFEGKRGTMEVSLVNLPPILQIQLQVQSKLLEILHESDNAFIVESAI